MTDKRPTEFPGLADALICDYMNGLDQVIALHEQLRLRADEGRVPPFYPDELMNRINYTVMDNAWLKQNYEFIRLEYLKLWMELLTVETGEPPYYTEAEFLNGDAIRDLNRH